MTVAPLHHENRSINYRVYALASSLSRGAMRFYLATFGLALPELRLLSTLGSRRRLSSVELVKLTAMDKGLVSRVLNGLGKPRLGRAGPVGRGLQPSCLEVDENRRRIGGATAARVA
jgi:hypothetical protein